MNACVFLTYPDEPEAALHPLPRWCRQNTWVSFAAKGCVSG